MKWKIPNKNVKKTKIKNTKFTFWNSMIVMMLWSLILGDSEYIAGKILNIFLFTGANIPLGMSILRNGINKFFDEK